MAHIHRGLQGQLSDLLFENWKKKPYNIETMTFTGVVWTVKKELNCATYSNFLNKILKNIFSTDIYYQTFKQILLTNEMNATHALQQHNITDIIKIMSSILQ